MAGALGLSLSGYGHYDRGRQPFTIEQIFQLSRILGRSVEWLLGLETELGEDEDQLLTAYKSIESDTLRSLALQSVRNAAEADHE